MLSCRGTWRSLWNQFSFSQHPFDIYWTCGTLPRFLIRPNNKRQQQRRRGAIVGLVVQLIDRTQLKRVKKENIFIIASLKRFRSPKKTSPVVIELATQPCELSKILPGSKTALDPSNETHKDFQRSMKLEIGAWHFPNHAHRQAPLDAANFPAPRAPTQTRDFTWIFTAESFFLHRKSYLWERRKNSTRLSLFQIIALFGCWDGDVSREARGKLSKKELNFISRNLQKANQRHKTEENNNKFLIRFREIRTWRQVDSVDNT